METDREKKMEGDREKEINVEARNISKCVWKILGGSLVWKDYWLRSY